MRTQVLTSGHVSNNWYEKGTSRVARCCALGMLCSSALVPLYVMNSCGSLMKLFLDYWYSTYYRNCIGLWLCIIYCSPIHTSHGCRMFPNS